MMQALTRRIMLVEDNEGDVTLLRLALRELQHPFRISVASDGEEALAFLKSPEATGPNRPELILLDLNLPKKNGREVLAEIRADPALSSLPVVILSSSSAEEDVRDAYDGRANCYITKPQTADAFFELVRALEAFWFRSAALPA